MEPKVVHYPRCPNCGARAAQAELPLLQCAQCKTEFCERCYRSDRGRVCPRCDSKRIRKAGNIGRAEEHKG